MTPVPAPSESHRFLESVFAGKPDHLFVLLWTLPDKRSRWFQDIEAAVRFVESLHHQDIYVGTGLSALDHGPSNRCKSDEIAGLVGVITDIDLRSDAHPNATLPSTIEEALSILPPELPPTFVVLTGNGIHAWWLFREPWIF
jgi:putative DNA primase/helicase